MAFNQNNYIMEFAGVYPTLTFNENRSDQKPATHGSLWGENMVYSVKNMAIWWYMNLNPILFPRDFTDFSDRPKRNRSTAWRIKVMTMAHMCYDQNMVYGEYGFLSSLGKPSPGGKTWPMVWNLENKPRWKINHLVRQFSAVFQSEIPSADMWQFRGWWHQRVSKLSVAISINIK